MILMMIVKMFDTICMGLVYECLVFKAANSDIAWILGEDISETRGERLLVVLASLVSPFTLYASSKENVWCAVPTLSLISSRCYLALSGSVWFHVASRLVAFLTSHGAFLLHEWLTKLPAALAP